MRKKNKNVRGGNYLIIKKKKKKFSSKMITSITGFTFPNKNLESMRFSVIK